MKKKNLYNSLLVGITILSLLASCSPAPTLAAPTPTVESTITATETAEVVDVEATESVEPTGTPKVIQQTATVQTNQMEKDMQELARQELVSSSGGTYYRVQDFTGEWAKLSYYHWWPLNRKPENFAIRANVTWDSAMPNANPSKAGCGFVFHENGADNLHISFLSMDGVVRNYRVEKRVFTDMKGNYAGKFNMPADSAKIMLVVNYQWITFFVNGKQVVRFKDDHLKGGGLAFAVVSGSNNDFGTRCTFKDVELWEFN